MTITSYLAGPANATGVHVYDCARNVHANGVTRARKFVQVTENTIENYLLPAHDHYALRKYKQQLPQGF